MQVSCSAFPSKGKELDELVMIWCNYIILESKKKEINCCRQPEPEICNVRCPPFGCPRGPCPGICCYQGLCDACSTSKMPCDPPPPQPPKCRAPPVCCLRNYARAVGYPPESPLSPVSARLRSKYCMEILANICRPPYCTTVPICPSPCSTVPTSNCPYPCYWLIIIHWFLRIFWKLFFFFMKRIKENCRINFKLLITFIVKDKDCIFTFFKKINV